MRTYVAKRLLLIVPTLLGVAALVFFIMRVIPGDVTLLILGGDQAGRIDPAQIAHTQSFVGFARHVLGALQDISREFSRAADVDRVVMNRFQIIIVNAITPFG